QHLALPDRVEHQTARPLGTPFEDLAAEPGPRLALVGGAVEAAVAEVDGDVAGLVVHDDAAQAAEAWLLGLDQLGRHGLPVRGPPAPGRPGRQKNHPPPPPPAEPNLFHRITSSRCRTGSDPP